jgi:hypothetical protein
MDKHPSIDIGNDRLTLVIDGRGYTVTDIDTLRVRIELINRGASVEIAYDERNVIHCLVADKIDDMLTERGLNGYGKIKR